MAVIGNCEYVQSLGVNKTVLNGSFQCNGTNNPSSTTFQASPGMLFTVTYAATGVYTVTLDASLALPSAPENIHVTPQYATLATDWFDVGVLGTFNTSTRSFQIQAHRSGTGQAPTNTVGNRINFELYFRNSTGK